MKIIFSPNKEIKFTESKFNNKTSILNYLIKNQINNLEDIKKVELDKYSLNKDLSNEKNFIFTRKNFKNCLTRVAIYGRLVKSFGTEYSAAR